MMGGYLLRVVYYCAMILVGASGPRHRGKKAEERCPSAGPVEVRYEAIRAYLGAVYPSARLAAVSNSSLRRLYENLD